MKKRTSRPLAVGLVTVLALALTACGGSTATGAKDKSLAVFMPSSAFPYPAVDLEAVKSEAAALGYSLKVYQNDFDQSQEDQQVRQFAAAGEKPAAILWWPSNAGAALNSVRQLSQIAPVIQFDSRIEQGQGDYVKAWVGHDNVEIGRTNGQQALVVRAAARAAGTQLHSPKGNLLEFNFGPGITQGDNRHTGFLEATADDPFTTIGVEVGGISSDDAYKAAAQVIPKYAAKGIDFIYAMNYDIAKGVVRALRENGLTPGKNVFVIAGDLRGDLTDLRDGSVSAGVIQAGQMEGELAVRTAVQYLQHDGAVTSGTVQLKATPDDPGLLNEAPYREAFIPTPGVTPKTLDGFRLWGMDVAELTK